MSDPIIVSEALPPEMTAVLDRLLEKDTSIPADPAAAPEPKQPELVSEVKTEPAREPAKVEQTPPADDDELPENLPNEGRGDRWKEFRAKYAEKKKEAKELREQLGEFEGTRKERDTLKERIAKLEEDNKELGRIDSLSKLENHPDFRQKYVTARNAHVETVRRFAGIAEISADDLIDVLSKPEKMRYEAIDDMLGSVTPTLQTKIRNALDAIEGIDASRQQELADAGASLSRYQKQQEDAEGEHMAYVEKTRKEVFKSVAARVAKELDLNEADTREAEQFFLGNRDLAKAVEVLLREKAAGKALASKGELTKRITDMEAELKQYRGAVPNVSAGSTEAPASLTNVDFVQSVLSDLRKKGAL